MVGTAKLQYVKSSGNTKIYDANALMWGIKKTTPDLKTNAKYLNAKTFYIDNTMSCNKKEATAWMHYYMSSALTYGIDNQNKDWKYSFAAAYELYTELTK